MRDNRSIPLSADDIAGIAEKIHELHGDDGLDRFLKYGADIKSREKSRVGYIKMVIKVYGQNRIKNIVEEQMDMSDVFMNSSANGRKFFYILFKKLKEDYFNPDCDEPNVVKLKITDYTNAQRRKMYEGFNELREKNVVRRYKNGKYMINPNIIAPFKYYEEAVKIWESLKK